MFDQIEFYLNKYLIVFVKLFEEEVYLQLFYGAALWPRGWFAVLRVSVHAKMCPPFSRAIVYNLDFISSTFNSHPHAHLER